MIIQIFDYSAASVLKNYGTEFHRPLTKAEKRNNRNHREDQRRKAFKDECKRAVISVFDTVVNSIKEGVKRIVSSKKTICAELHRQSLLDNEIFIADQVFGELLYKQDYYALKSYHLWTKPVVKLIRKSKTATRIVYFIAKPWTEEMAFRMKAKQQGNTTGKIIMAIGIPFCKVVGVVVYKYNIRIILLVIGFCVIIVFILKKFIWIKLNESTTYDM